MKCSVWNCGNDTKTDSNMSFFGFPRKKEYLQRWLKFCRCPANHFNPNMYRVCMEHFKQEDIMEVNEKMVLRLGAIPCINKNGRSRTKIQKEKLNDYQEKNERCESSYLNDTNTSEDLKSAYALEIYHVNEPINIKYEKDDDPFVHNITNTKDILKTDFDIKYEHEYSNSQENNSISAQTNDNIVTEVEYGATAEAFIINEDSCCSAASESMANKVNGRAIKRKLSPTETIEWLREGPTTNCNKLNPKQKGIMAQFMSAHTDLAKSSMPNCAQGRSTAHKLWKELSKQLNAEGPPTKKAKLWKKVYADLKYKTKRKLSLNKERNLTAAEELIVEAAGLDASISGNTIIQTYSSSRSVPVTVASRPASRASTSSRSSEANSIASSSCSNLPASIWTRPVSKVATPRRTNIKAALLEENIKLTADHQKVMGETFDRLLQINYRQLKIDERKLEISERQLDVSRKILAMKEEKHRVEMAEKDINLQIKTIELQQLQLNLKKGK
ncbi:uncharacterized protein [Eurosta solidaginis]|uniref:uncharacterized protein isoform X2 n=1 Tax=Eurosta solidaginis TaxID=178769 RepID=UPI003530B5A2